MKFRMSDEPPKLRIAAETSDHEIRDQRAIDGVEWPTRALTANLLRAMRGAGRPHSRGVTERPIFPLIYHATSALQIA